MITSPQRLFLIDGSALVYRSHFAFAKNPLTNSRGEDVSAIFASINALLSLLEREKPTYVVIVFDAKGPTFRHEMYEEYKATREKMPDELAEQLPRLKEILRAMGLTLMEQQGVEADDLIGTLTVWGKQQGWDSYIVSEDKDFVQLINESVFLYKPGRRGSGPTLMGVAEVKEKYDILPRQMIDYLALIGDSSDNVPGVKGVGPKTAVKLLNEHGSLDGIYENIESIKGAVKGKLEGGREFADLSKELVTIKTELDLPVNVEELEKKEQKNEILRELLKELELYKLIERLAPAPAPVDAGPLFQQVKEKRPGDYKILQSLDEVKALAKDIRERGRVALAALHTYGEERYQECFGLGFALIPEEAYYLSLADDASLPSEESLEVLREIFEDPSVAKIGHDLKEVWIALSLKGIALEGITFDTMLASHLLAPSRTNHEIDTILMQFLSLSRTSEEKVLGSGKYKRTWADVYESIRADYLCEEVDLALQLVNHLEGVIGGVERSHLLHDVDVPLIPVLAEMESTGVAIDTKRLERLRSESLTEVESLKETIVKWAGDPSFNVQSPQQVGSLLFDKLMIHDQCGVTVPKTPKTGKYKTDSETLESLTGHELPRLILSYREVQKRLSTYINPLISLMSKDEDGIPRIHTRFRQVGTVTGRLSSFSPNLQNIPVRTQEGREIRKAFVPGRKDWVMLSADYSQLELRILAHVSDDEGLKSAFAEGVDVHSRTASLVFGVFPEFVTPEQRNAAKAINFGISYGMGPPRLSKEINVSVSEAGRFIKSYFKSYPGVKNYLTNTIAAARIDGYVDTLFGRRREIPDINTKRARVRSHAEHTAVNTPIQGTAADLIKKAMINIARRLKDEDFRSRMLLQIHDELLFEVPTEEIDRLSDVVRHEMMNAIELTVPLIVSINTGPNWSDAH